MMKIEIISTETIKPSSPTPNHLTNLKLSFLDQLAPPIYVPVIFFFHSDHELNPNESSSLLKKSLAECLTLFYPLAGRMRDYSYIDCNDEGVEYVEAKVSCNMSQMMENPDAKALSQLLPTGSQREALLAVQFNALDCGAVAIGVCLSHKLGDGTSLITFGNAWAALSRGARDDTMQDPSFDGASHFPPQDTTGFTHNIGITQEKIITKRFVFNQSNIEALRKEAISNIGSEVKAPTRVEAVSALIWKHYIAIARSKSGPPKICAALHAVDLRKRMEPPLSMQHFGNHWRVAIAASPIDNENHINNHDRDHDHILVGKLRNAIRQINGDYVKKLQKGNEHMDLLRKVSHEFAKEEVVFCNFTSWCRFPVYEADFGWGQPAWVCSPSRPYKNVVVLMSTKDGEGIEAWVNMLEEDMAVFERDPELLSFVSSKSTFTTYLI